MRLTMDRPHSFAAMLGLATKSKRAEDDKDPKEVDDDAKAARAEGEADPEEKEKPDAKKAAADADDCPECDGSGVDDDGEECEACEGTGKADGEAEGKKGKKAKRATARRAEDDDDSDMKGRRAERRRWGQVLAKAIPEGKALAACALLHDTPMAAGKIIETLAALPGDKPSKSARLEDRMREVKTPAITPDGGQDPTAAAGHNSEASALAAKMLASRDKALGRAPAAA